MVLDHLFDLYGGRGFRDGDVCQFLAGAGNQNVHVLLPVLIGVVVNADARLAVLVVLGVREPHNHFGVLFFLALGRAVLAVLGDVEDRTLLFLKAEGLHDHLFIAREVLAACDYGEFCFAGK